MSGLRSLQAPEFIQGVVDKKNVNYQFITDYTYNVTQIAPMLDAFDGYLQKECNTSLIEMLQSNEKWLPTYSSANIKQALTVHELALADNKLYYEI